MYVSDHLAKIVTHTNILHTEVFEIKNTVTDVKYRIINEVNICLFKDMLCVVDWNAALDRHGADVAFTTFHVILMGLFDACFPEEKTIGAIKSNNHFEWYTDELRSMENTMETLNIVCRVMEDI